MWRRLRQLAHRRRLAHRAAAEAIDLATDEMPQRVTAERVAGDEPDVDRQHQRAEADAEVCCPSRRATTSPPTRRAETKMKTSAR